MTLEKSSAMDLKAKMNPRSISLWWATSLWSPTWLICFRDAGDELLCFCGHSLVVLRVLFAGLHVFGDLDK